MNSAMTMSCPCLSFRLYAANALGIAVVADTVSVLIGKGTVPAAVIPAVFAVVADSVAVFIAVGAIPAAVVNGNCASALTSPAVMSAVSGYGNARHRNSQSKYGSNSQQFFHKTSSFQVKFIVCLQFTYQSCCSANIYSIRPCIASLAYAVSQPPNQHRSAEQHQQHSRRTDKEP